MHPQLLLGMGGNHTTFFLSPLLLTFPTLLILLANLTQMWFFSYIPAFAPDRLRPQPHEFPKVICYKEGTTGRRARFKTVMSIRNTLLDLTRDVVCAPFSFVHCASNFPCSMPFLIFPFSSNRLNGILGMGTLFRTAFPMSRHGHKGGFSLKGL